MRRLFSLTSGRILLSVVFQTLVAAPAFADWPTFGRAISTAPGDQLDPTIAPDGAGGAIITWLDRRAFPFNIDAQHVLASGDVDAAWPVNGRALLTDALAQSIVPQGNEFPAIASDGAGGAIVTWPDARNAAHGLDIYAHHVLASGVVDPAWPANGATVCSVTGEQASPVVISDGAGGAFIAWTDTRAGTTLDVVDVFAQHLLATGLVDPAWPANGTPICTAPKPQTGPAMVADGAGGFLVAWTDLRSGNPGSDVYAQHVFGSGVVDPAWPVNGFGLCTASGSQSLHSIISDGSHGAIVAWTDTRDGTNEIYAQRALISGAIAPGWPTNGRLVSIGGTDEVSPTLAADGASGAIVAWGGGSSGHHNMRAQHLLASGVLDPAWPVGGASLSFAPSEQTTQVMASDGAGGAIVAWQGVFDVTQFDIFAQHVLASGALDSAYPANGRAVCALLGLQHEPDIIATGDGGAIVAWMDTRDGLEDIYALQVLAAGTTSVAVILPRAVSFAPPSPSPARGPVTLRFALPRAAAVRLAIYDVSGRQVRELVSGTQAAGPHVVAWDLRDQSGQPVPAGVRFARLDVEGRALTGKVVTVR